MTTRAVLLAACLLAGPLAGPGPVFAAASPASYSERLVQDAGSLLAKGGEGDVAQAVRLLDEAVLAGNADAMLLLADLYRSGRGVAVDRSHAEALLLQAREAGLVAESSLVLGDLYSQTGSPLYDLAKARAAYQAAADLNNGPAMVRLARLVMGDPSGPLGFAQLHDLLDRAIANGEAMAGAETLGDLYLTDGPSRSGEDAARAYQQAADAGSVAGAIKLAAMLMSGTDIATDLPRARTLIRHAMRADRDGTAGGAAWERIGDLYLAAGEGRNPAEALKAYTLASTAQDASASVKLARLLMSGDGVAVDLDRAKALLQGAMAAGDVAPAATALGDLLSMEGPLQDLRAAAEAYDAAGEAGSVDAMVKLAWIYAHGTGAPVSLGNAIGMAARVEQAGEPGVGAELKGDIYLLLGGAAEAKLAAASYGEAVDAGRATAMVKLARLLIGGRVAVDATRALALAQEAVQAGELRDGWAAEGDIYSLSGTQFRDMAKAYQAYVTAAGLGNAQAMISLGGMLADGTDVPANIDQAIALFEQAVALGQVAAGAERLGEVYLTYPAPHGDPRKALKYFNAAADAGSATGHLNAARLESLAYAAGQNRVDMARHYREAARLLGPRQVALEMMNIDAKALIAVTQQMLNEEGQPVGADGVHGGRTTAAIEAFCAASGLAPCESSFVTVALLEALLAPHQAMAMNS